MQTDMSKSTKQDRYPHIATMADYRRYQEAVDRFLRDNRVESGLYAPSKESAEYGDPQPYFSWSPCGCCERGLGGDREDYEFVRTNDRVFEAAICTDCVYYLAYGQLDDMTMLEIGE